MLAPAFQHLVAWDCLSHGTHMLSVSYRDEAVRSLDADAHRRGVLLLSELGLDPGIDHMSAMALLDRIRAEGGRVKAFRSYGSGVPAPGQDVNPLGYWITWNPRNVVMSGANGAQYIVNERTKLVPHHRVFRHTWPVDVEGVGRMVAYPNRDSVSYGSVFGLEHAETILRATMRWPGWCETWDAIVRLGLPNESLRVPDLGSRSAREVLEMFLPGSGDSQDSWAGEVEAQVARLLDIPLDGEVIANLQFLGLFSARSPLAGRLVRAHHLHAGDGGRRWLYGHGTNRRSADGAHCAAAPGRQAHPDGKSDPDPPGSLRSGSSRPGGRRAGVH